MTLGDVLDKLLALRLTGARIERVNLHPDDALAIAAELASKFNQRGVTWGDPTTDEPLFRLSGVPFYKLDSVVVGRIDIWCSE